MSDDLIAPAMDDNEALRRIVATLDEYLNLIAGQYTQVDQATVASITTSLTALRSANPTALKTLVTNTGSQAIDIYEGGSLVKKALAQNETWVSELQGRLDLSAKTGSSTSSAIISTYILLPFDLANVKSGQVQVQSGVDTVTVTYSDPFEAAPTTVIPQPLKKISPTDADAPAIQEILTSTASGFTLQLAAVTTAAYTMAWTSVK